MTKQLIATIAILACTAQVHATEYQFVSDDHSSATRFCIAAGEGDLDGLRQQIRKLRGKSPHVQYKTIVNSIRCNGQIAAQFANTYGAKNTFDYLYMLTDEKNRKHIGRTSVEEVALNQLAIETPDVVIVRVSGR